MLVLTVNIQESVMINDDSKITVLGVNKENGKVKIGFDFPPEDKILREKVYVKDKEMKRNDNK